MTVAQSRFFPDLVARYPRAPSIALCRVPELELLSAVTLQPPVLDHCCGDGWIAGQAFPGRVLDAGVDISRPALAQAAAAGRYRHTEWGDAGRELPFGTASFRTVFNNSGIEHIPDLDRAIAEIARVLAPGGRLHINVLNRRYFERWPLSPESLQAYRTFQPFLHALDEEEWSAVLTRHGFEPPSFADYFAPDVSRILAELDYAYSAHYLGHAWSLRVVRDRVTPGSVLRRRIVESLGPLSWEALPRSGSGFLITAVRRAA